MNFREMLEQDINEVFLDKDEYARDYTIDGKKMTCCLDKDKSSKAEVDGVYLVRRLLFLKESDIGYRPIPGQKLNIDGQYFYVIDCAGDGLLEIHLEARNS